ncbi:MAG: hypothetical protein IKO51_03985 [Clostridia bacterium]|nr:hypothetical protein [Clostridia bacterium]
MSCTIGDRPVLSMVMDMAQRALPVLPRGAEPILHSDQGWQYQHKQYQKLLNDHGIADFLSALIALILFRTMNLGRKTAE